ncbi:MAG: insulinase family protein, partial [Coriobacteriales bacterium]|nr:insulinase family protein [Coriobacteriales bacterium]
KKETVESFDSAKMHEYHQKHYTSENIVVAAAGNIDHDLVVELTQKLLANAPSGEMLQRPDFVKQNRKDLAIKNKDTEQAHLLVGFPGLGYFDDTKFACRMMSAALGGSMSSRLFVEIREKRGLAYAIACSNQEFVDCGTFYIMAGTRPENVEEVLETTFSELKKLVSGGVTQEELDRSRELICGNTVLAFESTSAHMRRIGNHAVRNANLITIDDLLERYKSISLEECNDIAKSIFEQTPTIAMVSPIKDDDANTRLLKFV